MTRWPDRREANLRYYCDNDPMNTDGGTRWTLRPDPPVPQQPANYVLQRDRESHHFLADMRNQPFQEWEDGTNGIYMFDKTPGCNNAYVAQGALAYDFTIDTLPDDTNTWDRATVTVCDAQLGVHYHSFDDLLEGRELHNDVNVDDIGFDIMTAIAIFREVLLPPQPTIFGGILTYTLVCSFASELIQPVSLVSMFIAL
ncbi:MAG: hypothetical protein Q9227_006268 [Pyrenula ochraceoflavens]